MTALMRRARSGITTERPVDGIAPGLGEEAPGHRELAARHGDGAMMEVDAEREIDRVVEHAERLHVVGKRAVAKAGALLGGRDRLVDRDRWIVGEKAHEPQDLAQRLARADARTGSRR